MALEEIYISYIIIITCKCVCVCCVAAELSQRRINGQSFCAIAVAADAVVQNFRERVAGEEVEEGVRQEHTHIRSGHSSIN